MSDVDPIELALAKLGANVTDNATSVMSERPVDLTTNEGKIELAMSQERNRRRYAAETVFGTSDPMKTLESWPMIANLNHQGLEHIRYTSQLKVNGKKYNLVIFKF